MLKIANVPAFSKIALALRSGPITIQEHTDDGKYIWTFSTYIMIFTGKICKNTYNFVEKCHCTRCDNSDNVISILQLLPKVQDIKCGDVIKKDGILTLYIERISPKRDTSSVLAKLLVEKVPIKCSDGIVLFNKTLIKEYPCFATTKARSTQLKYSMKILTEFKNFLYGAEYDRSQELIRFAVECKITDLI